jgi:nitroreductase
MVDRPGARRDVIGALYASDIVASMDLYEALYTTRAMRRVSPDPIPTEDVEVMLDAAIRAPSGSNAQNWRWMVVTERDTMTRMAELYRQAWQILNDTVYKGATARAEAAAAAGDDTMLRVTSSSQWLADHFQDVPLVILPYHRNDATGASIYPAVWNLMLAARGRGIGTTLTTILGAFRDAELAELIGVPQDKGWVNAAAITCGHPTGTWGVARRAPVHDVTYQERWGEPPEWRVDVPLWDG